MLKASGEFILPSNVPANEFLNLEGSKISTSKNWAVWLHEYLKDFPDQQDVLRYVLTANAPETKDNDFTWIDFQARNNNELVAIYGNFVNRIIVLTHKYFSGKVPSPKKLSNDDNSILDSLLNFENKISVNLEKFKFRDSLKELLNLARLGNKYLADQEPWKLIKTSPERVSSIIYVGLQIVGHLAHLSEPFLPFTSAKLLKILNLKFTGWDVLKNKLVLKEGHSINNQELLFSIIENSKIEEQLNKLKNVKTLKNEKINSKFKPKVNYKNFEKLELKVGEILNAEKILKTRNLLKLKVSIGENELTIVSGIADQYNPKKIIGKKVTVLTNLKPRKIKGVESQGMILMAKENEKNIFISPSSLDITNGSKIY